MQCNVWYGMVWFGMVWYVYVCMYVSIYLCIYLCIYVSMYLCMYVSMYVCMYVHNVCYVCIYICTCNYMYIAWYYMILYVGRVITPSKATEITHGDSDIKNFPTKATIQLVQLTGMQATHVVWCVLFNWRRSTGLRLLWRSWCRPETPEKQTVTTDVKLYQNISTY